MTNIIQLLISKNLGSQTNLIIFLFVREICLVESR